MPKLLDEMLVHFLETREDYLSNSIEPSFPNGLDIEIMKSAALIELGNLNLTKEELEHVTLGFRHHHEKFRVANYSSSFNLSEERWTVDYPEDYLFISKIYGNFIGQERTFGLQQVLRLLEESPNLKNELYGGKSLKVGRRNYE